MLPEGLSKRNMQWEDERTDSKQGTEGTSFNLTAKDKQANHIVLLANPRSRKIVPVLGCIK